MGETGKRNRSHRDYDGEARNPKRRHNDNGRDDSNNNNNNNHGSDELVVYRILCPVGVIGSVIGKSGKVINSLRQESRAKIKVVDPFPGASHRVLTIYCYVKEKEEVDVEDEFDDRRRPLCAAQDALLRVHGAISGALGSAAGGGGGDSDRKRRDRDRDRDRDDKEECRILVPTSQAANVIGKAGATIKRLRSKTRTSIKVNPKDHGDPAHSCAMNFDNFVQITGEPDGVRRALFAISSIMYKFSPKEQISLETTVTEVPPSIIIPSDLPIYPPGSLYSSADSIVTPRSLPPIFGSAQLQDLSGYTDPGNAWSLYQSALPVVPGFGAPPQSEELVVRVLCPFDKIGRVIGKSGGTIKSIRQASGARVEVDDTKEDRDECIVTIISTESGDDQKSMGVEAVLLLQGKINDEDDDRVSIRLLVTSKIIGCIIGKSGSIINEIRRRTKADVRISKGAKPKCADANDELVEISGDVDCVKDALVQIVLRLRDDVLRDRDSGRTSSVAGTESLYSGATSLSGPSVFPSISQVAPLSYERTDSGSGLGMIASSSLYGYGSLPMGENGYGSISSYPSKVYGGLPATSTLEIIIPANAVGKVFGKGGANLANIRKISGALVDISDSKSSRGDRIALISGTPEQKHTAESLIQAFMMST